MPTMSARIVFDLDGTLIDSAPDIRGIANAALARFGADPISLAQTHDFIGEGVTVFVEKMRAAGGLPDSLQDELLNDVVARYDDAVGLTVIYPGVLEALTSLSRDYRLGVCTNKLYRPAMAVLQHLRLADFFEAVSGGDNPLGRKPDPAALLAVYEELGDGPLIYVGDSEIDAETARRASIPFFLFSEGYRKQPISLIPHDVAFAAFSDLPDLLASYLDGM